MKSALLLLLALPASLALADGCPGAAAGWQREALAAVNAMRAAGASCGERGPFGAAAALRWSPVLESISVQQARSMAELGVLEHAGLRGEDLAARALASGYAFGVLAENLASGALTLDEALAGWRASADHCANLLGLRLREAALACVPGPGGPWWVMTLGAPPSGQAAAPMTPPPRQMSPS